VDAFDQHGSCIDSGWNRSRVDLGKLGLKINQKGKIMPKITLEELETKYLQLGVKLATLKKESAKTRLVLPAIPATELLLNPGERYVGGIVNPNGSVRHIILLPGDSDQASWKEQMEWAASRGGELFDRVVGALLAQTMPDEFKAEAYWTCEQHAAYSYSAWFQDFGYGSQYYYGKLSKLRARAIRSVTI